MVKSLANVAHDVENIVMQGQMDAERWVQVVWSEQMTLLGICYTRIRAPLPMLRPRETLLAGWYTYGTCNIILMARCVTSQPIHLLRVLILHLGLLCFQYARFPLVAAKSETPAS